MQTKFRVKDVRFRVDRVVKAADRAEARYLYRAGGLIRITAKRSMRSGGRRNKRSAPGEPPRAHSGELRRLMRFSVDAVAGLVVIGPLEFKGSRVVRGGVVPGALERGGVTVVESRPPGRRGKQKRKKRRVPIAPRPYMYPALKKVSPQLKGIWRNSVR